METCRSYIKNGVVVSEFGRLIFPAEIMLLL